MKKIIAFYSIPFLFLFLSIHSCERFIEEDILNNHFRQLKEDAYGILKVSDAYIIASLLTDELRSTFTPSTVAVTYPIADCDAPLVVTVNNGYNPNMINTFPSTFTLSFSTSACPNFIGTGYIVYLSPSIYRIRTNNDFRLYLNRATIEATVHEFGYHYLNKNYTYTGTFVYSYSHSVLSTISYQGEMDVVIFDNSTAERNDDRVEVTGYGVGTNDSEEVINLQVDKDEILSRAFMDVYFTQGILHEQVSQRAAVNKIDYNTTQPDQALFYVGEEQRVKKIRPD